MSSDLRADRRCPSEGAATTAVQPPGRRAAGQQAHRSAEPAPWLRGHSRMRHPQPAIEANAVPPARFNCRRRRPACTSAGAKAVHRRGAKQYDGILRRQTPALVSATAQTNRWLCAMLELAAPRSEQRGNRDLCRARALGSGSRSEFSEGTPEGTSDPMRHKNLQNGSAQHQEADRQNSGGGISEPSVHARIELRAYELWRAGRGGSEVDHWLQAEREITQETANQGRKSTEPLKFRPPAGKRQ